MYILFLNYIDKLNIITLLIYFVFFEMLIK